MPRYIDADELERLIKDHRTAYCHVAPVVHAHWDFWDYDKYDGHGECIIHHPMVRCSNCKHGFRATLLWVRNYCPNCGAKMGEEAKP